MVASKARANRSGKLLENAVAYTLDTYNYLRVAGWLHHAARSLVQRIYTPQYWIGQDIYGRRRRVDFLAYHPQNWPDGLLIQCKWQASSGSVDEKFPFEALSIDYSEIPALIVLDGGGYSAGAEQWLKQYSQSPNTKLVDVVNLGAFQNFAKSKM
ncbi:PD-(D/E)XK nuclease superfamily protein [Microbacterium maritypicum]|uniref:PD-(D/E)XK nuclease superfamily protein n=1 Tax=Microbacterium maritypicum TaxID=33918 RepID=UPI00296E37DD|nr:PD-(D/E)XK nuclease superfamily protein [Microbacterium liquefaciens]